MPPILKVSCLEEGPALRVLCTGAINSYSCMDLQAQLNNDTWEDFETVLLDLKGVDYVDSAGLAALMVFYREAKRGGCRFQIVNYNSLVEEVAQRLGLFERLEMNPADRRPN